MRGSPKAARRVGIKMLPVAPSEDASRSYDRLDATGGGVALKVGLTTSVSKTLRAAS